MDVKSQGDDELAWPHDPKRSLNIKSFCNALQDRSRYSDFPSVVI